MAVQRPAEIVVSISGGLGNQMFQYAAGRALALRNHVPLRLDTRAVEADPQRSYALSGFNIAAERVPAVQVASLPRRVHRRLRWLPRLPGRMAYVAEKSFGFDPAIISTRAPAYLDGHWQSEAYFADAKPQMRVDFSLGAPFTSDRQEIAAAITGTTAVSVHVRRGDYVSNNRTNAYHGTCDPHWYRQAMDMMEGWIDPIYFVFSDDPAWARENLVMRRPAHFVQPSDDGRDFEDIHLMALCRHHIVANSSFSWWGAWLNPRDDKRVVAPTQWFRQPGIDTSNLLPANWVRL
jgi:hypothetical protein